MDQDPQGTRGENQAKQRHQVELGEAAQGELRSTERPAVVPPEVIDDRQLCRQNRGHHQGQMHPLEEEEQHKAVHQHTCPSDHKKFAQADQQGSFALHELPHAAGERGKSACVGYPTVMLARSCEGICAAWCRRFRCDDIVVVV